MVQNPGKLKLSPCMRVGVRRKLPAAFFGPTVCDESSKRPIIGFFPEISPTSANYSSGSG